MRYQFRTHCFEQHNYVLCTVHITKLLIMQFSVVAHYCFLIRLKYLPRHSELKHLQSIFLSQCNKTILDTYTYNGYNYGFVYITMGAFKENNEGF
jgi:hypothetical protein